MKWSILPDGSGARIKPSTRGSEVDQVAPLTVCGQTKPAADQLIGDGPRHCIVHTSWIIGDGKDVVRTMLPLTWRGIARSVVDDPRERVAPTPELARAIGHFIETRAQNGTYHVTGSGPVMSREKVGQQVLALRESDSCKVRLVQTAEDSASVPGPVAPRQSNSALNLANIQRTGFLPNDASRAAGPHVYEAAI